MSASLLAAHLEQISLSCQGIDSLLFPPPKIFTNALLSTPEITSLIRDTEAHERALFSVPPPSQQQQQQRPASPADADGDSAGVGSGTSGRRRQTVFNVAAGEVTTGPPPGTGGRAGGVGARRNTAVAAVLGGDLHSQITRVGANRRPAGGGDDVDIEMLLRGAQKLCRVYPLPGALERIPTLRQRHAHQTNTLAYYEARVAEQAERLGRMHKERYADDYDGKEEEEGDGDEDEAAGAAADDGLTEEELRREEEEVRDLERKKKELQERLRAMDKDLGGLLHM